MRPTIAVSGLREFTRALQQLDNSLPKAVRLALNAAAGVVVDYGRARMPRRTGRAAGTIKAKSSRTLVRVGEGSKRAPYVPWLDFGGRVGPAKSVSRPYQKDGRYLYPALQDERAKIQKTLEESLQDVADSAGLDLD